MAWRDPETLTCPECGKRGDIVWLIGEGPNTAPDEGPAYTDILEPGLWQVETHETRPRWRGRITCPDCSCVVREIL